MTDRATLRQQAAQVRAAAADSAAMNVPRDRPEQPEVRFRSQMRAKKVLRDEMEWYEVKGYASVFETAYEMWDMFGPYNEIVSAGAADETLSADPECVFRFNHAGTPMASTRNTRLELSADETGLGNRAWINPKRADVQLLVQAIEDGDVREQSFMFRITDGQWSPDYTEYRINAFDLDRGDVGPVTYGANPHTSVSARSGEFLAAIEELPPLVAREAYTLLSRRADVAQRASALAPALELAPTDDSGRSMVPEPKQGRSVAMIRTQLLVEQGEDE